MFDSLLTVEQVARILNCKDKTIYSWAGSGRIPCLKINGLLRFVPSEITTWIESLRPEEKHAFQINTKKLGEADVDTIIKRVIASAKGSGYTSSVKGKLGQSSPERRE